MDSYVLYPPGGSNPIQLASWIELDRGGVDTGAKGLLRQGLNANVAAPGGKLAWEQWGIRNMRFPLIVGSHAGYGGLLGAEKALREAARPGAWIDFQPENVPSSEAVRFDVVAGRYEEDYHLRLNTVSRRRGDLYLQTQPLGYWPTWITLASTASVIVPGVLAVPGGSIIGDAHGALRLTVMPTAATSFAYAASQTWRTDFLAWSMADRASMMLAPDDVSVGGDTVAPLRLSYFYDSTTPWGAGLMDWRVAARSSAFAASGGANAVRGARFRAFAYVRGGASAAYPFPFQLDLHFVGHPTAGLATWYGQPATAPFDVRGASVVAASPAYHILDLGEVVSPLPASGASGMDESGMYARLWYRGNGTTNIQADLGGVTLLRTDGLHGVLQQGLNQPTVVRQGGQLNRGFQLDTFQRTAHVGRASVYDAASGGLQFFSPIDVSHFYYGDLAAGIPASTTFLQLVLGGRRSGYQAPYVDEVISEPRATSGWALYYYRLQDAATTVQFAAPFGASYGPTGVYLPTGADGPGPWALEGALFAPVEETTNLGRRFGTPSGVMIASGVYAPSQTSFSVEWWAKRNTVVGTTQTMLAHGTAGGSWRELKIAFASPGGADIVVFHGPNASPLRASAVAPSADASYQHYVYESNRAASYRALYRNGSLIASYHLASEYLGATGPLYVGALGATHFFPGYVDEVSLYAGNALGDSGDPARVTDHYAAGIGTGGATTPLIHHAPLIAQVSVEYRPRFQFLRGI